jgi:hypothetical protein
MSLTRFGGVTSDPDDDALFFTSRPERTEPCPRCRGCGTIANPYALRWAGLDERDLRRERAEGMVTARVVGSFTIFDACREAAMIARAARRAVAFRFNDRTVVVNVGDDGDRVARQWWLDTYGETPEQTAARR